MRIIALVSFEVASVGSDEFTQAVIIQELREVGRVYNQLPIG